ncbi:MAG TPA: potassium channel family protein [Silvibacterium sp.]|nr:potassium channel family protein [Silvibacterium sp.]
MHLLQIVIWGFFYAWKHGMPDLQSAVYFSAVTYTTTGYGDLVLPKGWRLAGGVEALTGILMCGLSAGLFFAVFAKAFYPNRGSPPNT